MRFYFEQHFLLAQYAYIVDFGWFETDYQVVKVTFYYDSTVYTSAKRYNILKKFTN